MLNFCSPNLLKAKTVSFTMTSFFIYRQSLILLALSVSIIVSFTTLAFSQAGNVDPDPVQLFNQGQDAHEKGDLKTALKLYDKALKLAPEFPEAEFQKGVVLQILGRDSEAEQSFRRALSLRENWVLPMAGLGEMLVRAGKFSEAETILSKALELDEANLPAYVSLANLRLKAQASPEVLKNLLTKLTALPNPDASIWTARGALEIALGDRVAAKTSFARALTLESKNLLALSESTEILLAEKNYPLALAQAQTIVNYYPNSLSAKLLLARSYAESENIADALKIIDSLADQNKEVLKLRNTIIAKSSTDIGTLEKQLQGDAKNSVLLGRLCLLTRTNPAQALDYCRRASEVEPNKVSHAIGFGAALVQARQFENAVHWLRKVLPSEPENFAIHANLATALFELKRYQEAKSEFQWLSQQKPDLSIAYYFLAIAHDNLAEYSDALTNYKKFLQLADSKQNQLEIDKVNLRLPSLEKQIKNGDGTKKGRKS